jgi:nucleotide-binding universal stress UspA family protein
MRVILAVDGSAAATDAVALVEAIAWPQDSVLRVISVIEPTFPALEPWYRGAATAPTVDEAITAYTHDTLGSVVERLQSSGRSVEGEVLRGRAASAIVDDARAFGADLLVVGSRGHGTIESLLLGSVSGEVADHAECPVLVARTTELARVVFATDGSSSAAAAERILSAWPIFDGLQVRVVSVANVVRPWMTGLAPTMYEPVLAAYAVDLREATVEHERLAAETVTRLRDVGRAADPEVRAGDAAAEILAIVEQQRADLVVLGSRGHTGVTRLLLGSVARNVLAGSTASVLIVRDGIEQPAEARSAPDVTGSKVVLSDDA